MLAALVVVGLVVIGSGGGGTREEAEPASIDGGTEREIGAAQLADEGRDEVTDFEERAPEQNRETGSEPADARPLGGLRVEVTADGKPVEGAVIELAGAAEPGPAILADGAPRAFDRRAVCGEDGEALLEGLAVGRYAVRASALVDGGERSAARFVGVGESGSTVELALERSSLLVLRVVGEQGEPAIGAEVEIAGGGGGEARDPGDFRARLVSDAKGRVEFDAGGLAAYVAVATAPDGRCGSHAAWRRDEVQREIENGAVTLAIGAPARLSGRVLGIAAQDLGGAHVLAHLVSSHGPYHLTYRRTYETEVDEGGWSFAALPAGSYVLELRDPGGARFDWPLLSWGRELPNSLAPIEIELEPSEHEHVELAASRGATLEGTVRDERDRPIEGARVRLTYAPACRDFPDGFVLHGAHVWRFDAASRADDDHPSTHWRSRTGADGAYRLVGLPQGRVRVEVAAPGKRYDRREAVELVAGESTRLEHRLPLAGAILGVLRQGGTLGVRDSSGELLQVAVLASDGHFRFDGLAPAAYELVAVHSDESIAPVALGAVEVRAGTTSWIDLDGSVRWPFRLKGVVLERGVPVAGTTVRWSGRSSVTGEDGQFEFGTAFPPIFPEIGLWTKHRGIEVHHAVAAPARSAGEWTCELALGLEALTVRAVEASGAPASATLAMTASSLAAPAIRSVSLEHAAIEGGSLDVVGLFAGEYSVEVEFSDGAVARTRARVPAHEPLLVRAPPAGSVTVRLRSRDGEPVPLRRITASTQIAQPATGEPPSGAEAEETIEAITDADGVAELRGVVPGDVVVRARRPVEGSAWRTRVTAQAALSLAHGEHASLELIDDGP